MEQRKSSWQVHAVRGALAALLLVGAVGANAYTGADQGLLSGTDGSPYASAGAGTGRNSADVPPNAGAAVNANASPYASAVTGSQANSGAGANTEAGASAGPGATSASNAADGAAVSSYGAYVLNAGATAGAGANANPRARAASSSSGTNTGANRFGVQIAGGVGGHDVKKVDLGFIWDPGLEWWRVGGYHFTMVGEVHAAYWDVQTSQHVNPDTWEFGVTPVFRFIRDSGWIRPYIEAGIGVRMLAHVQQETDHTMSSSFQFSDMIGLGAQFGLRQNYQAGFRFQHLSNAGLEQPNPGINFSQLYLQYNF